MSVSEAKADDLVVQAEKKLNAFFTFGNRQEEACELFEKAANLYKVAKKFKKAGDTFIKTVSCHLKLSSKYDAARAYQDAANCFRKKHQDDCVKALQNAVSLFCECGKFSQAAKIEKDMGEMLEKSKKYESAAHHFKLAAEYYEGENSKSTATTCLAKVAHLYGLIKKYSDAVEIYEEVADNALEDKLLSWGAKDYLFKALICRLASMKSVEENLGDVKTAIEDYKDKDMRFGDSRECKLIETLVAALEKEDIKKYKRELKKYDDISKLDPWKTSIFLAIKEAAEKQFNEIDLC